MKKKAFSFQTIKVEGERTMIRQKTILLFLNKLILINIKYGDNAS